MEKSISNDFVDENVLPYFGSSQSSQTMQIDSIDGIAGVSDTFYLGCSNLEGNIWDGAIRKVSVVDADHAASRKRSRHEFQDNHETLATITSQSYNDVALASTERICDSGITKLRVLSSSVGHRICTAHDDGTIGIYDDQLNNVNVINAHDDTVSSIIYSRGTFAAYNLVKRC